jgi:methylglutaconyl-CoA hydratase
MIHELSEGYVKVETHNAITTIEFSHPKGNCLPRKILEDLAHEIHIAGDHDNTRVLVLRSGGDQAFCGGAFFDELLNVKTEKEAIDFFSGFAEVINAMRKCPKFIIARVQGRCVGGAVGIAAAADYCIASLNAEVRLSELSIGIGPFVIGPAVERKIGVSAFSQLAIDATSWRNAEWAKRKALYAEVHESIENMDESVSRLANSLAHFSPEAMSEMKQMFWRGTENWDQLLKERASISGRLTFSDFSRHAIQAKLGAKMK